MAFYSPTAETVRSWDKTIKKTRDEVIEQLVSVELFANVGEPWKKSGKKYEQVTFSKAIKNNNDQSTIETRWESNPRLKELYFNRSTLLNIRSQHYQDEFGYEQFDKQLKKPLRKLLARKENKKHANSFDEIMWCLNDLLVRVVWERLHVEVIENPLCEREFEVLMAAHLPALPSGSDPKKSKVLYC